MFKNQWVFALVFLLTLQVGCQSNPPQPTNAVPRSQAKLRLPNVFDDHMVLQRNKPIPFWGSATPGQSVEVWLGNRYNKVNADSKGRWFLELDHLAAGGPHTLTVKAEKTIQFKDVLIGEVWLCSGQSNMEWRLQNTNNAKEEIKNANYPNIRFMKVKHTTSPLAVNDVVIANKWAVISSKNAAHATAVGYFFGRTLHQEVGVPIGLIDSSWGGTRVEPWTTPQAFNASPDLAKRAKYKPQTLKDKGNHNKPTHIYNAMIEPLIPYAIRGVIWYQGESNRDQYYDYQKLFSLLIYSWRDQWDDPYMPFYFAQLAPYKYGNSDPRFLGMMYDAQLRTHKSVKHTGMAVLTDIGNLKDIHPRNKVDVGDRLARWALVRTYGKQGITVSGPLYQHKSILADKIKIDFDHAEQGLKSSDGKPLSWFTIAGQDQVFHPAIAVIQGNAVVVSSDKVKNPVAVRFGFHHEAIPNLQNTVGLPASPFRTDDWPLTK